MRDPARIPGVLEEIRKAWESSPDLRLGQLISNLASIAHHSDPFYIEDDRLVIAAKWLAARKKVIRRDV